MELELSRKACHTFRGLEHEKVELDFSSNLSSWMSCSFTILYGCIKTDIDPVFETHSWLVYEDVFGIPYQYHNEALKVAEKPKQYNKEE